jgi:hypothetical protein
MSSPVAAIADALIAFILSLLRDPSAAEDFADDPHRAMEGHGVQGACMADLRAVTPIILDDPQVEPNTNAPVPSVLGSKVEPNEVVREIGRIINQFTTVDARSTTVDQSVNQNIWTQGGDVTQLFDQEAVIASGDDAVAAGNDAATLDQDLDLTVGDVSVGNDTYNDSFDDADVDVTASQPGPGTTTGLPDAGAPGAAEGEAGGTGTEAPPAQEAPQSSAADALQTPASLPEPADHLESDLTATAQTYDADVAAVPVADVVIDDPVDE